MLAYYRNFKTYLRSGIELLVPMYELNILGFLTFGFAYEERLLARLYVEDSSPLKSSQNEFAAAKAAEAAVRHCN